MLRWHTRGSEMHGMGFHDDDYFVDAQKGFTGGIFPFPAFELIRQNNSVFSSIFGYQGTGNITLSIQGQAELANGEYVSGNYFHGLGVRSAAGRLPGIEDDRAGAPAVAAISFALSQKRFGGPASAVGQSWHPHGARRTTQPRCVDDFARSHRTCICRAGDQCADRLCCVEACQIVSLWSETQRSAGPDGSNSDPAERRHSGWLPACPKCLPDRPDDRAAARMRPVAWLPQA